MSLILGVGTDNGVFIVAPGRAGDPWQLLSAGLSGKPVSCLAPHPDGSLYVGIANGTLYRTRNLETWEPLYHGLPAGVCSLTVDPSNPELLFCGVTPAALYVSGDKGQSFLKVESLNRAEGYDRWTNQAPPHHPRLHRLILHPQNSQVVLAVVQSGGLYISGDHGQTWHHRSTGIGIHIEDVAIHPALPQRIYGATQIGFYRSDDLGTTWEMHNAGLAYTVVTRLAVAKEDPNVLMMAAHRNREGAPAIFRTLNGGDRWEICPGAFPTAPTTKVTAMTSARGMLFAATNAGDLMGTQNFGGLWAKLRPQMAPIRSLAVVYQQG